MDQGIRGMKTQFSPEVAVADGGNGNFYRFKNMRSTLGTEREGETYAGEGSKFNTTWQPGDKIGRGELSGPGSFSELVVPFDGVFCRPTVVNGAGSSVSRTYIPNPYGPDTVRTWAQEKGNDTIGRFNKKWPGVVVNGLTLNATRRNINWTAPIFAQGHDFIDVLTPAATKVENRLISAQEIDLFYSLVSFAALDSSPVQVLRLFEYNLEFNDRFTEVNPMNSSLDSWAAFVESQDPIAAELALRLGVSAQTYSTTSLWAMNTAYTIGTVRRKSGAEQTNKQLFRVVTAGTTHLTTEPADFATATEGQLITDNTVVWEAVPYDMYAPFSYYDIERGTEIWLRLKMNGPAITTGVNYMGHVDLHGVLMNNPADEAEGGLMAGGFQFLVTPDDATDQAVVAKLVNKVPDW